MGEPVAVTMFRTVQDLTILIELGRYDLSVVPLRLIQITDPHIRAEAEGTLLGFQTQMGLDMVLAKIREDGKQPDAIVVTGDIAHDYSDIAYRRVIKLVKGMGSPMYWCPGNHDDKVKMARIGAELGIGSDRIELGNWLIQLLDTAVPGKVSGHLSESELALADAVIESNADRYVVFGFHHQPVPQGSRWIDELQIDNGAELVALVQDQPHVKALFWGHVHQELDRFLGGVRLLSTPSSCVQFRPKSDDFALDRIMPGYRWFDLYPDGTMDTGVVRVDTIPLTIDYDGDGY